MNKQLEEKIKTLPMKSGVYVMHDKMGRIIYVGKAKHLKNRVSQYFQKSEKPIKVAMMVEAIADFDYYIVPSEKDAFVLERNLIRKEQPFYNILLKDGKAYSYIKLDMSQAFPKLSITRRLTNNPKHKYFGPFFAGVKASEILKIINYAYPLRMCEHKFDEKHPLKRECLNYSLGLCSAPCTNKITREDYLNIIKDVVLFLSGEDKLIKEKLVLKMKALAETENFESAIKIKEQLSMLEKYTSHVITELPKSIECAVFSRFSNEISSSICVLNVKGGKILGVENFNIVAIGDSNEVMKNFISSYYEQSLIPPKEILVDEEINEAVELKEYLFRLKNVKCDIVCPKKSYKLKLIGMAKDNAKQNLEKNLEQTKRKEDLTLGAIKNLKEKLKLLNVPNRIECFDISHISGTDKVASMVVFESGEKSGKMYRKFKIKTVEGNNDFECLKETLTRRFIELTKQADVSFSKKPDLVVIDGGKGQLSSIKEVFDRLEVKGVDLISLAKQFEEVYTLASNIPVMLKRGSVELRLLQNLRDEAHRFAISFHRNLHQKELFHSSLIKIKGVGKEKEKLLLEKFGTIENIINADEDKLASVKGINLSLASKIKSSLK